jgi:hypothetical protein
VPPDGVPTLTRCCLLEDTIEVDDLEVDDRRAVVPWGSTLPQIEQALRALSVTSRALTWRDT